LDAIYATRAQVTMRDTEGPGAAYMRSLTMTPGQLNEAIEQIQVDGLKTLNDGLVDAIVNFKSLGDVALNVIRSIAAQLIQLAITRYLMAPLAGLLGLGGGGGAASGMGSGVLGIASSALSFMGGGKAAGGPINKGRTYLVGEHGPELFAPGVGGSIVPSPRAAAMMGLAARIGRGSNDNRQGPVHIHFSGPVSDREARVSGAQAARAFRDEQARLMRMGA
jgi:hypothetical protein